MAGMLELGDERFPVAVGFTKTGDIGEEQSFELVRLNVGEKAITPTTARGNYGFAESLLDRACSPQRIICRSGRVDAGDVRTETVEIEKRRHVRIGALTQCVAKGSEHAGCGESAAPRARRGLDQSRLKADPAVREFRGQDLANECFLGQTLAHDDDLDQRLGLPPTTFIFHNSPSEYSSSHSFN